MGILIYLIGFIMGFFGAFSLITYKIMDDPDEARIRLNRICDKAKQLNEVINK